MAYGDRVLKDDNYFRYLSPEPAPHELGIPEGYSEPLELKTTAEMMADRDAARAKRNAYLCNLARNLRESASTLARQSIHELPVMSGFCARLCEELIEAAQALDEKALTS